MSPLNSYGSIDIKQHDADELIPLARQPSDPVDKKMKYLIFAGLAGIAMVIGRMSYPEIASQRQQVEDKNLLLSKLSPVDMGFESIVREDDASPSVIWGDRSGPLPTNSWYLVSNSNNVLYFSVP